MAPQNVTLAYNFLRTQRIGLCIDGVIEAVVDSVLDWEVECVVD